MLDCCSCVPITVFVHIELTEEDSDVTQGQLANSLLAN